MKFLRRLALTLLIVTTALSDSLCQITNKQALVTLFAVRLTDAGITQMPEKLTGYFFVLSFLKYSPKAPVSPQVTYYQVFNGDTVERQSLGYTKSLELMRKLAAVDFESFNFKVEEVNAENVIREEVQKGLRPPYIAPDDGAEYEIEFNYKQTAFRLKCWNPAYCIPEYAQYSPRIAKLDQVINLFASYYGREKFGL
jgi:hypothetical protein